MSPELLVYGPVQRPLSGESPVAVEILVVQEVILVQEGKVKTGEREKTASAEVHTVEFRYFATSHRARG